MSLFTATAAFNFQPSATGFVYYGGLGANSINLGFQKWFKGVVSTTYTTDPIPSSSYTITVRSIVTPATTSSYTVPSGQLFNITGSVSGSTTFMYTGTYPNLTGDERAGNGVGYNMLVEGPSDLRSNPLNSMPRPIAKRIKVRSALTNAPFNYIDATGSVVTATLASTSTDYFFDIQGVWNSQLETAAANTTTFCYDGESTASFTGYVEGTRQYTATRIRGSNAVFNWLKQFATASMDMQNALVSATTYTFKAALPPQASNFSYGWSGSGII